MADRDDAARPVVDAGPGAQRALDRRPVQLAHLCLLYTSDAADERSSVDLGGRRIIKKKNKDVNESNYDVYNDNHNITR